MSEKDREFQKAIYEKIRWHRRNLFSGFYDQWRDGAWEPVDTSIETTCRDITNVRRIENE